MTGSKAHLDKVAEAICGATGAGRMFPWDTLNETERDAWREMARAAIQALQLAQEEQWVVVAVDGSRWVGRSHASAVDAVNAPHPDDIGEAWQPHHIERETRLASPWVVVEEPR